MNLSLGIVGLPNVGKSTLFNALTKQKVVAANYPFATIDPNVGIVPVTDYRLDRIAEVENPEKTTPAVVEFVDIAGLVKGAAEGEGLGNQFLANIREVNAIVHLVRAFQDPNVTHVENSVNPERDIELIHTELILKDLETIAKRKASLESKARVEKELQPHLEYVSRLEEHLSDGKLANLFEYSSNEDINKTRAELFLLTDKPIIFLINTDVENADKSIEQIKNLVGQDKTVMAMDIKTEAELAELNDEDRREFMKELGISHTGLELLTQKAYQALGLISFFTAGPKEVRAWTIKNGFTAPQAAGTIHTDFEKNFIFAEICTYNDFGENNGWNGAKEKGKVRLEGKTYIMKDGDVVLFKHNA